MEDMSAVHLVDGMEPLTAELLGVMMAAMKDHMMAVKLAGKTAASTVFH